MIKFYRDLSICYLLAFLLGLPAVLLYFDHFKINFLIILFLGGVYLYIVSSLFTAIASKRLHKLVYELYFDCKIKEYIEECKKLLKNYKDGNSNKPDDVMSTYMKLNLCTGYFSIGNYEEANQILKNIRIDFKDNRYNRANKVVYYNNLLSYKIRVNEFEYFFEILKKMKDIINNEKFSLEQKKFYLSLAQILEKRQIIEVETDEEKLKEAELFFLNLIEIETLKINKVYDNYVLIKIYEKLMQKEKMQKCIDYVLENGGDTVYVDIIKKTIQNDVN